MINYGIITGEFTPKTGDVTWAQNIHNEDGSISLCFCIKTSRSLSNENVTVIGSNDDFIFRADQYKPKLQFKKHQL